MVFGDDEDIDEGEDGDEDGDEEGGGVVQVEIKIESLFTFVTSKDGNPIPMRA